MTSHNKLQPVSAWLAQVLRCTMFYCLDEQFDISGWWSKLTGSLPETETKQPKTGANADQGSFGDGTLILTKNPVVVDLRLQVPSKSPKEVDGIPAIGSFEEQRTAFVELVKKLFELEQLPGIKRIAFGAVLNLSVQDYQQGLRQLAPYIQAVKIDPANSTDFMYRINRRRSSAVGIPDLLINRLNTWSVVSYHSVLTVLTGPVLDQTAASEPRHACQLELDISTCQEFKGVLPSDKLATIVDELVSMGIEIANNGDVL
jgi:hypothetical protein